MTRPLLRVLAASAQCHSPFPCDKADDNDTLYCGSSHRGRGS